jgi:hypothetical protein
MNGYRKVQMAIDDRFFDRFPPRSVTPVAIELLPASEALVSFEHPDDALYVFGPEDGGLPKAVRRHCHRFVFIPTHHCLNLAAAVNVVLYDRRLKRQLAGREPVGPLREMLREQRGWIAGPAAEDTGLEGGPSGPLGAGADSGRDFGMVPPAVSAPE